MWTQLLFALATAALSSLFTLGLAWWLFDRHVKGPLQDHIDQQIDEAIEELGATIEQRVRQGVRAGVASIPSTEVLADTTRNVARTGADLVGLGLATLLGGPKDRR
ncbi:MAG: hypothetical protein AAGN66_22595 [Acidobacteriota bacterium]